MARHQACDACKRRKVRCDGQPICEQCRNFDLTCVYSVAARPLKRTRSARGQVIAKFKQHASGPTAYDHNFFAELIQEYMEQLYPLFPVISETEFRDCVAHFYDQDRTKAAFLYAAAAVTICKNVRNLPDATTVAKDLLHRALETRGVIMPTAAITITSLMTSLCISSCLVAFHNSEVAWLYLREAMTMATILRVGDLKFLSRFDLQERARRQRLYWMLYIHERFMAVHYYRPAMFGPLPCLPDEDPDLPAGVHRGFVQIIKLFSLIDGRFLDARVAGDKSGVTDKWAARKRLELDSHAAEIDQSLSEIHRADLFVTQQWIKLLVWQMASKSYDSNGSKLDFLGPLARDIRTQLRAISVRAFVANGRSIFVKLFDLSQAMADFVSESPSGAGGSIVLDYEFLARYLLDNEGLDDDSKARLQNQLEMVLRTAAREISGLNSTEASPQNSRASGSTETSDNDDPWLMIYQSMGFQELPDGDQPLVADPNALTQATHELLDKWYRN